MMKRNLIVVFDDGEIFNDLRGCKILEVTDEGQEKLNEGEYPKNLDSKDILGETIDLVELLETAENEFVAWI